MNTTHHIDAGFSIAADRLEQLISRLTRDDPRLVITREHQYYVCEDIANGDEVMIRNPDPLVVVKWARAFTLMTDGATLDERSVSAALGSGEAVKTVNGTSPEQDAEPQAPAPAPSPERHLRVVL